jgi:hypothetical protein
LATSQQARWPELCLRIKLGNKPAGTLAKIVSARWTWRHASRHTGQNRVCALDLATRQQARWPKLCLRAGLGNTPAGTLGKTNMALSIVRSTTK